MFETSTSYCHSLEFEVFHIRLAHLGHDAVSCGPLLRRSLTRKDKLLHTFCFGVSRCFWKKLQRFQDLLYSYCKYL